ncbi:MAG: virulence factor SrfB [Pirellulales bacterium]|nr:virulence factor SrfB [Pirellulales bacterium]
MHVLFANTGVQAVCVPLRGGSRYQAAQIGYGWQRCQCGGEEGESLRDYPYVQWQVIQSGASKLFLAVDTTCGDPEVGHFCQPSALTRDFVIRLEGLLDLQGQPLKGIPDIDVCIRPATATAGDAKHVHMVIDFGNSRTGVLLLELAGEISQTPQMLPFELTNRYHLDAWNEEGEFISTPAARWFSSKTHWCNTPYLPPLPQKKIEYHSSVDGDAAGWFGRGKKKAKQSKVEVVHTPPLFDDLSMVRMGREADDVAQVMRAEGDIRTGVSSPKRYLWADDASWLEGANWHMGDPSDRCKTGTYAATLKGPFLRFVHEDDRDFLLDREEPAEHEYASETPLKPRHAPRCLMTAAIYELLCQAYSYINSPPYRNASGDAGRTREIRTVTLTFPSGMIQEEQKRLRAQVNKAINVFALTLGKNQGVRPELNLSIDEASAVHLTYIWSEMRLLGQDPRLWFATLRQDRGKQPPKPEEPPPEPMAAAPAGRRRGRGGVRRPGAPAPRRKGPEPEEFGDAANEIRIACIDIGGGTSDLMIAKYHFESKIDDAIRGQVIHQDGIYLGGDQLVKRLLETIIVPASADALGLEDEDVQLLFGPEVPRNREIRAQRVNWINRLFVPLTQAYLDNAVDDVTDEPISHTDPEIVDPAVVESLQRVFDKLRGPGYYNVQQELDLTFDRAEFEGVVHDVFDELLFDYCQRIVDHDVDVVLLAGQPSKLSYIQQLVRMYVPLSPSRIVPMHNHYAGNWYPYQDEKGHNPGVIIDPKSPVVVGAAIEFLARQGMLPQFKFEMKGKAFENSYYWGVMTDATSGIRNERILFQPAEDQAREEITEFTTSSQRVLIGRKLTVGEDAQATPAYLLKMEVGDRIGPTEVVVKIKRKHATKDEEEMLEVDSVTGVVAGEDAILGENVTFSWRTLADERYYLDTGGLDNIELSPVP